MEGTGSSPSKRRRTGTGLKLDVSLDDGTDAMMDANIQRLQDALAEAQKDLEAMRRKKEKSNKIYIEEKENKNTETGKEESSTASCGDCKSTCTSVDQEKEKILIRLLEQERDLRKAPETQKEMELAEASVDSEWMDVAESKQTQIVQQHNQKYPHQTVTVHDLRLAALRHPEIAFWVKFNRARQGTLRVGDAAPNVPLRMAHDHSPTTLLAGRPTGRKVVVLAGSWS